MHSILLVVGPGSVFRVPVLGPGSSASPSVSVEAAGDTHLFVAYTSHTTPPGSSDLEGQQLNKGIYKF